MKRVQQNLVVDVVAFAAFVLLAATGVVMAYTLPPRSGHTTTLWGLSRHEWGDVHVWIAVFLMALLAVHLAFHWKWIGAAVRGRSSEGNQTRWRVASGLVGLTFLIALVAALLLTPPERADPIHAFEQDVQEPGLQHEPSTSSAHEGERTRARQQRHSATPRPPSGSRTP